MRYLLFFANIISLSFNIFIFMYFIYLYLKLKSKRFIILLLLLSISTVILFHNLLIMSMDVKSTNLLFKLLDHSNGLITLVIISFTLIVLEFFMPTHKKKRAKKMYLIVAIYFLYFILFYIFKFKSIYSVFFVHIIIVIPYLCSTIPILIFIMKDFSSSYDSQNYKENLRNKYNFSKRENELIPLLIKGLTYKEIGEILFISKSTVCSHVCKIYKKSSTKKRSEFISLFSNI